MDQTTLMTDGESTVDESYVRFALSFSRQLGERYPVDALYITGSLAAGLGNATSDLDLVAIAEGQPEMAEWVDGDGFVAHVETFSRGEVEEWLAELAGLPHTHSEYSAALRTGTLLENLSRLYYAEPVVGVELVEDWRRRLDATALRQAYMLYHSTDAITYARDALGAMQSDDLLTAWDAAQQTLRGVLLMALAAAGDLYYGRKWLLKRLAACRPLLRAGVTQRSIELLYPAGGLADRPDAERVQVILDRMRLASALSAFVTFFAWETPLSAPPSLPAVGSAGNPWYVFARFRDTCFAGGPNGWPVSRLDVLAWLLCRDGQDAAGLAAAISAQLGVPVSDEFVAGALDRLRAAGLAGEGLGAAHGLAAPADSECASGDLD
jgi:hypothetical protein